jgi:hypothetical protein
MSLVKSGTRFAVLAAVLMESHGMGRRPDW